MKKAEELYDLLFDYANLQTEVEQVIVGQHWTVCRAGTVGLSQTHNPDPSSTHGHHTPLSGRSLAELSQWLRKWDPRMASIGLAAANAAINREADMVYTEGALFKGSEAQRNSFGWFAPQLRGQHVVVIGDAGDYLQQCGVKDVTRIALPGAVTPEAEQLLPLADWVFLPANAIADKTLPRLLTLSSQANCVLYGTEVPWMDEWWQFGVDYLVGSQVDDAERLQTLVAEAAPREALFSALSYRVIAYHAELSPSLSTPRGYAERSLRLV